MVYEMNPPMTRKRTHHSLGTLSAHGDSLADTTHLIYVNYIKFDRSIDILHIWALANSTPTYCPSLWEFAMAVFLEDDV